jgi:hypothetical protein
LADLGVIEMQLQQITGLLLDIQHDLDKANKLLGQIAGKKSTGAKKKIPRKKKPGS